MVSFHGIGSSFFDFQNQSAAGNVSQQIEKCGLTLHLQSIHFHGNLGEIY